MYTTIIRGTPVVVQLLITYNIIFAWSTQAVLVGMLGFGLNSGAYVAEIMRGGINAVDIGQTEAGRSLGLSSFTTMKSIVLPQAIKNVLPSIGNEFVVNIKDSSVLSVIAITELMFIAKQAGGAYAKFVPAYVICAVIYFILTFTVTRILRLLEKKLAGSNSYTICGSQSDPNAEIHVKEGQ